MLPQPIADSTIKLGKKILRVYQAMHYDAIAVGPFDLASGYELLVSAQAKELPLVSANIYKKDGTLLFSPYRSVEKKGVSIAFVGLTDPSSMSAGITISDGIEELKKLLPELVKTQDLIVLLTSFRQSELKKTIDQFPDIDIIIGADYRIGNDRNQLLGTAIYTQPIRQGRFLTYLTINWNGSPWRQHKNEEKVRLNQLLKAVNRQLITIKPRKQESKEHFEQRKKVIVANRKKILADIHRINQQKPVDPEDRSSIYSLVKLPLSKDIPSDPEIDRIFNKSR